MKLRHDVIPVYVEWVDSMGTAGWNQRSVMNGKPSDITCVTIGHLIKRDKDRITVCENVNAYQYGEIMEIPMSAVTKIKKLRI